MMFKYICAKFCSFTLTVLDGMYYCHVMLQSNSYLKYLYLVLFTIV